MEYLLLHRKLLLMKLFGGNYFNTTQLKVKDPSELKISHYKISTSSMWQNTKTKNLLLWARDSSHLAVQHLCIYSIIHICASATWLHNANWPLFYIQLYERSYLSGPKQNGCQEPLEPARFQHVVAHFWLNCPCLPVTQLDWAVAVTRNEVVNFELTPFRVTNDVNMCYEFGELHTAIRATGWPLTYITPPNLSWGEVNEAYWGELH